MTTFIQFRDALNKNFNKLSNSGNLFQSAAEKDTLWDKYLSSFPEGTNLLFRERTEHDCNCCKRFIRNVGRVLGEIDGEVVSVFSNLPVTGEYKIVADTLAKLNIDAGIAGIYLNDEQTVGQRESHEQREDENGKPFVHTWNHFYQVLPQSAYSLSGDIGSRKGKVQTNCKVLKRSITTLDTHAVETVIELIDQNSLHRGGEMLPTVKGLKVLQTGYESASDKELFLWNKTVEMLKNNYECNIRGTAIGTLLVDLSEDMDLEVAVKKYEDKVSGTNYKRTSALVTPRMKTEAQAKAKELGIEPSFSRRMATKADISVNDVLHANNSVKPFMEDSIFDMVDTKSKNQAVKNFDKVEEMSAEDFIKKVLPKAESVELFLENKHESNLVSLIAPVNPTAPCIMKWDNNFSWSYNGEVAESDLKTQVQELGGRVDGDLRFSHTWNYDGKNQSLMDLHVFLPDSGVSVVSNVNDNYGNSSRVGWNQRNHYESGGVQDVDFVNPPLKAIPVENITFPSISKLKEGKYIFKIHNWQFRNGTTSGFKAEIELNNTVYQYEHKKALKNKEWITVAEATLKDGVFTIKHHMKESTESKVLWGVETGQFHKVDMVMRSPNYWDNSNKTGNDHLFFMLDKCVNPEDARGWYSEFLPKELMPHRKVFEVLSSQLKAEFSEDQLSGVGFSSTLRNDVVLRVKGSFNRMIKIKF